MWSILNLMCDLLKYCELVVGRDQIIALQKDYWILKVHGRWSCLANVNFSVLWLFVRYDSTMGEVTLWFAERSEAIVLLVHCFNVRLSWSNSETTHSQPIFLHACANQSNRINENIIPFNSVMVFFYGRSFFSISLAWSRHVPNEDKCLLFLFMFFHVHSALLFSIFGANRILNDALISIHQTQFCVAVYHFQSNVDQ